MLPGGTIHQKSQLIEISEHIGSIKVPFDTNGYVFYQGRKGEGGFPFQAFAKLVAVKGNEKIILPKTTSLKGYVSIKSLEGALAFVRLFTSVDTDYLFEDSPGIEATSKADASGGKIGYGQVPQNEWERLKLFEPKIRAVDGSFLVERCLLNYNHEIFHSEEKVSTEGEYSISKKETLQKNSKIQLPYYE